MRKVKEEDVVDLIGNDMPSSSVHGLSQPHEHLPPPAKGRARKRAVSKGKKVPIIKKLRVE